MVYEYDKASALLDNVHDVQAEGPCSVNRFPGPQERCLADINGWIDVSMLKTNSEKTYVVLITSKHNAQQMEHVAVDVRDSEKYKKPVYCLRLCHERGSIFNSVCRSGYHRLGNDGHIRRYLITVAFSRYSTGF